MRSGWTRIVVILLVSLFTAASASAQDRPPRLVLSRAAIDQAVRATPAAGRAPGDAMYAAQAGQQGKEKHTVRRVLWTAVGATGGFFVGGYMGGWLDLAINGDCNCDDPGLKGVLIGAPIGSVAGGIAGWLLSK